MELLCFVLGFVCGILGVIIWAACAASSKESRKEEVDGKNN